MDICRCARSKTSLCWTAEDHVFIYIFNPVREELYTDHSSSKDYVFIGPKVTVKSNGTILKQYRSVYYKWFMKFQYNYYMIFS